MRRKATGEYLTKQGNTSSDFSGSMDIFDLLHARKFGSRENAEMFLSLIAKQKARLFSEERGSYKEPVGELEVVPVRVVLEIGPEETRAKSASK